MNKTDQIKWYIINKLPFKLRYLAYFYADKGRMPRLLTPKDYCDFIFLDNFFGRHNKHAFLADKYSVREYVKEYGLGHTLTRLYGAWDDASKIDFDKLPCQFAIKLGHSCGMNIICTDKSKLDIDATRKQLANWSNTKHPIFFEQHYNHIKPMIICEELILPNEDGSFPTDYKIHCANGKPVLIQCCFERNANDAGRRIIYDIEWNNLHYVANDSHYSDEDFPRPRHLKEMLESAAILSKKLKYARIDFYDTDSRIIFGEITLTPMGGLLSYFKQEALDLMGKEISKGLQ